MLKDSLTELCCGASLLVFAFLMFFQLVLGPSGGTFEFSLARFGTSVASFLGLPQGFRGLSWTFLASLGLSCAALGPVLAVLEPILEVLGLLLGFPLRPSWPKMRRGSNKVPQDGPKSRPRTPKQTPQKATCSHIFWGPFLGRFQHSLSEGFLDVWPLKIDDFAWEVLQKCWFSPDVPKSKKSKKK